MDGYPEDWIKAYHNVKGMMPLRESAEQSKKIFTLFKRIVLAQFDLPLGRRHNAEDN
jgi:hypothetical protein